MKYRKLEHGEDLQIGDIIQHKHTFGNSRYIVNEIEEN
jgi:hypothetical protein